MAESQHPAQTGAFLFSFSATAANGSAVIDRIEASSTVEAWGELERRGYTAIRLLDNEATAIEPGTSPAGRLVFSAAEEDAMRKRGGTAALLFSPLVRRANLAIWAPLLGWLTAAAVLRGFPSPATTLPLALLTAFVLWYVWSSVPRVLYNVALRASAWYRWDVVLRCMGWLTLWKRWFRTPMPDHELLFRTATAEAGLGRLADALARVAPLEHDTSLRPGCYHARLAAVYTAAGRFGRAAVLQHEARKRNPTDTATIDLATTFASRLRNYRAAQALLDDVDAARQPPMAVPFLSLCQGLIALHTGNAQQAVRDFEQGLEAARGYAGSPLMETIVVETRANYALALAATGQAEAGAVHLKAARSMLAVRGEWDLLARCDAALAAAR